MEWKYHKNFIEIIDKNGKIWKYSIKRIIPMKHVGEARVYDVEILLDKKNNHFFSIDSFLKGESWATGVNIHYNKDKRIKKLSCVANYIMERMTHSNLEEVDEILSNFENCKHTRLPFTL